ncbi:MAG: ATP-binding cassette domain-containing protein [Bacteroidetes bacterium]|nr:ATP-binding cassette domain-containing protein [Bacteroidota bacterium]
MIEITGIKKKFGEKEVLKGIDGVFQSGKMNMIIGGSGSGKTVLMKCIVGLLTPEHGHVMYDGRNFHHLKYQQKTKLRQEIGMLFQYSALFDSMTVEENVAFPLKMFTTKSKREISDRVNFCLDRVNLVDVNTKYPDEISGGMRKRVGIARAISLNPKYLFCDEPNSGLDPITAGVIDKLIKEITEEFGTTTVLNTHDMNSVLEHGDNILFLYNGLKEWEGAPDDIKAANNKRLNEFIYANDFIKDMFLNDKGDKKE